MLVSPGDEGEGNMNCVTAQKISYLDENVKIQSPVDGGWLSR